MNGSEDDDDIALGIIIPLEDSHFEEINSLELWDLDIMTADAIKKKGGAADENSESHATKYDSQWRL
jgi:hypothetical protein